MFHLKQHTRLHRLQWGRFQQLEFKLYSFILFQIGLTVFAFICEQKMYYLIFSAALGLYQWLIKKQINSEEELIRAYLSFAL